LLKVWYNILVTYFVQEKIGVLLKLNKKLSKHVINKNLSKSIQLVKENRDVMKNQSKYGIVVIKEGLSTNGCKEVKKSVQTAMNLNIKVSVLKA